MADLRSVAYQGIECHENGRLEQAERLYREYVDAVPDDPAIRHLLGMLRLQRGDPREARQLVELAAGLAPDVAEYRAHLGLIQATLGDHSGALESYRRAAALDPNDPDLLHRLGAAELLSGHTDLARAAFERAIELDPELAAAHNDLGALHLRDEALEAAVDSLSRAVTIDPDFADAHYNLAIALEKQARYDDAVGHYERALATNPDHTRSYRNLAALYYKTDRPERLADVLERQLARQPNDPRARHMLAAVRGERLGTSDPAYVRELFDGFAASYDERLAGIEYRGPDLLALALERLDPPRNVRVLDLGCGTGLCARVLAPHAATLVGVDLSANMLEAARRLGSYAELHQAELVSYLTGVRTPFELIAVVDTFVYVGDLTAAFHAAAAALTDGGLLIFTVEAPGDARTDTYALSPSGRFQHAPAYLQAQLTMAGLNVVLCEPVHLRLELGQPVDGLLVAAQRPLLAE